MARISTLVRLFKNRKRFRVRKKLTLMKWSILLEMIWMKVSIMKKTKTAPFLWRALGTRAAKVGKGLSDDAEALKLELQHWLEAIDHSHRYGHNLNYYHTKWLKCQSRQPFFYWLDVGEGRMINLEEVCPRSKLQTQLVKYLGPKERQVFEVMFEDGKILYKMSKRLVDTTMSPEDTKWIFVLSTTGTLYIGQKKKGIFQHSSFLSGAAILAAGSLVVEKGILKAICRNSGHYRPTDETVFVFKSFLKGNGIDITHVKVFSLEDDKEIPKRTTLMKDLEVIPKKSLD